MMRHLDAFDVATGGVDDGSGLSPTMEAARLIMAAGGKPDRTILACLWAGEELVSWVQTLVETNKDKLRYFKLLQPRWRADTCYGNNCSRSYVW